MAIPGLKKPDHIGFTVPNLDEAIAFFSKHFDFELAYEFGPFVSQDDWMAEHLNVNPRAEIKKIAVMSANNINLEIFEYADNIHRSKTAPNNADIGGHHMAFYVEVFSVCQSHRKEKDFVDFIKALEHHHYGYTQLQIVADNLNTHQSESLVRHVAERSGFEGSLGIKGKSGILKNQIIRAEFLSRKSHKIVFNYTPKHASWMNQIEIWFGILMRKVLKRGNFVSTDDLKSKLTGFINYQNEFYAHPYNWKYGNTVLKTK